MKDNSEKIGRNARLIARAARSGALATSRRARRNAGQPYVSKVGVALLDDGAPLFLFSTLAAHTQDLLAEARCSLLVDAPGEGGNPLQAARATLVGRASKITRPKAIAHARAVYLARHPDASGYVDFGDFAFWRLDVERVHYVGGFGRAKWVKGAAYLKPCAGLAGKRATVLQDINERHTADLNYLAGHGRSWRAVDLDADGLTLSGPKDAWARVDFPSPAADLKGWRARFKRRAAR